MVYRLLLSACLAFLFTEITLSQVKTVNVAGQSFSWAVKYYGNNDALPVIGSPYLNKDWLFGTVTLYSNQVLNGSFRFNLLDQEMEMIYKSDTLIIANPESIKFINFSNRSFYFLPLIEKSNGKEFIRFAFCEEVLKAPVGIYKNYIIDVKNNSYASNYMGGGGDGRDYYHRKSKLVYKNPNSEVLRELPLNLKKLSLAVGIDYLSLKKKIRENYLDISKEKDMIKLLTVLENEK
jgi:hypothetical protein